MFAARHLSPEARPRVSRLLKPIACLAASLTASFALSLSASAVVTFTATQIASGDTYSSSVVSGDFDSDGILDLVTFNASTISFYKGLGGGQYAAPVDSPFVGESQAFAADFDRDGKLDLAVANGYYGTSIFLGNGDGTFRQGTNLMNSEATTGSLAVADFNGDHIPDIAMNTCPHMSGCQVQVYLGNGDGTFTMSASGFIGGAGLVVGDFNADGHQDLAVLQNGYIDGFNGVAVCLGDGTGHFQSAIKSAVIGGAEDQAVGDFYGDRIQSLAVVTEQYDSNTGGQRVYVQTVKYSGGQLVATPLQLAFGVPSFPTLHLASGDLNGNFKDDIVISGYYNYTPGTPWNGYMLGTGKGTFAAFQALPVYGNLEQYPFVRDLNQDSRHDIGMDWTTTNNGGGGALVFLNTNATPACTPPPANTLGVHICAPRNGQTIATPFTFKAAGNAFSGVAKRMELWIDGKKAGQNWEDQLKARVSLTPGTHTATFIAIDSFDNISKSSVTFTSK